MKLDRNTNRGGRGKYALVNMRKLIPVLDSRKVDEAPRTAEEFDIARAFHLLVNSGIITLGNETPGDQFFVMKYKDKFAAAGLKGYAEAVWAHYSDLMHCPVATERMEKVWDGAKLDPLELGASQAHHLELKSIRQYAGEMFEQAREAGKLGNRIPD